MESKLDKFIRLNQELLKCNGKMNPLEFWFKSPAE